MSRKSLRKSTHEEGAEILMAAEKAGADYAEEQVGSEHFRDWVYDQMIEADRMRKADPDSVVPLESMADARRVARNMLQQLEWDTKRQMDSREILELSGAKGVFDSGSASWVKGTYGITAHEVGEAFFTGFVEELKKPTTRDWLAEEVLQQHEGADGEQTVRESTTLTRQQLTRAGQPTTTRVSGAPRRGR